MDGDGRLEFVQILGSRAYRPAGVALGQRESLIEVLNIR